MYVCMYVCACVRMCVGNFMYFTAQNKYMIMGSRFVIGKWWSMLRVCACLVPVKFSFVCEN